MQIRALLSFLVFVLLQFEASSQDYIPFPESDAVWYAGYGNVDCALYEDDFLEYGEYYYVLSGEDTTINNNSYKSLFRYGYGGNDCNIPLGLGVENGYIGAIRQEVSEQKVFFMPRDSSQDKLIYDYSLQEGDTIDSYLIEIADVYEVVTVTSVDSIMIGQHYRKRIRTSWLEEDPQRDIDLIEGVGSNRGFLEPFLNRFERDAMLHNLCVNDTVTYANPNYYEYLCDYTVGLENSPGKVDLSIYPQPADDRLIISSEYGDYKIESLRMFNSQGELVGSLNPVSYPLNMEVTDLPGGIYFIEATMGEGIKSTQKLVIAH